MPAVQEQALLRLTLVWLHLFADHLLMEAFGGTGVAVATAEELQVKSRCPTANNGCKQAPGIGSRCLHWASKRVACAP